MARNRRRIWFSSNGIDENLQLVGGDPWGTLQYFGLRVPTLATPTFDAGGRDLRYLFNLCSASLGEGESWVLRRVMQFASIGEFTVGGPPATTRPIEFPISSPMWRFVDGDISWHLVYETRNEVNAPVNTLGVAGTDGPNVGQANNFMFRKSDTPALLFEAATFPGVNLNAAMQPDFYVKLSTYTPPNRGRPFGGPVPNLNGLWSFTDMRFPWNMTDGWSNDVIVPIEGPGKLSFYASVRQSNPATRPAVPGGPFGNTSGMTPEEGFLLNFPNAIYWRVAGGFVLEEIARTEDL